MNQRPPMETDEFLSRSRAVRAYYSHREECGVCTAEVHCDVALDLAEALADATRDTTAVQ